MITINCIENINSISLNGSSANIGPKMELLVENWLNENKDWFKHYAIENLDLNTVEKWLRSNNKKICKCFNTKNKLVDESPTIRHTMFNKRNSMCGPLFSKTDILQIAKTSEKKANDLSLHTSLDTSITTETTTTTTTANNANSSGFSACLNAKKVKFFNKDSKEEAKSERNGQDSSAKISTLDIINNICLSHSHTCIIHNRPSLNNAKQKNIVNMSSTLLPLRTDELNDLDDEENEDNSRSPRKNSDEENHFVNSFNTLFANKVRKSTYETPLNKMPIVLRRNSLMRKYHTFYACDSTASLNILKMLIESKIKFPANSINAATSLSDKLKLKREKKNDSEFLLELVKDISNELNLKTLTNKILNNLKLLVNAEKASLFYVCHSRKCLASFKFDPHVGVWDPSKFTSTASLTYDSMANDFEMEFGFGNTIVGMVAETGNVINIPNASKVSSIY